MSEEENTADTATSDKSFDAKVTKLGDEIAGLTLKEAVDLTDYMKDAYGIEPAAGGAVMVAGGGGGASHRRTDKSRVNSTAMPEFAMPRFTVAKPSSASAIAASRPEILRSMAFFLSSKPSNSLAR